MVGNAIKFTYEGSIKIKIGMVDGNLVTNVTDTGIGMEDEDLE